MTVAVRLPRRKKDASAPEPADLLAWYDRHRRILPWRARRGERADPYAVWLSEIMLQQTTVKTVAPYYARFLARWPSVAALAASDLDDVLRAWAGLGYYARARNLHACARAVMQRHGGIFPRGMDALRALARLFAVEEKLPAAKPVIKRLATSLLPPRRAGDFAQALMDLGATLCSPKNPACALCPWNESCAAARRGDRESFPRKTPKREGSLRRGAAFVALRADGRVLLRQRPDKGLLASMTEVPGSAWAHDFDSASALAAAPRLGGTPKWQKLAGVVRHVFTHFPLELTVFVAQVPRVTKALKGARWVRLADLPGEALPNVMRKVLAHALKLD
ncbi:MAG: A/G-specific adenine glycosylase [Rhizobiales bacterium]|nr:A/G-specific adenine glycosylase [Hyphomicrobiales bacterium]